MSLNKPRFPTYNASKDVIGAFHNVLLMKTPIPLSNALLSKATRWQKLYSYWLAKATRCFLKQRVVATRNDPFGLPYSYACTKEYQRILRVPHFWSSVTHWLQRVLPVAAPEFFFLWGGGGHRGGKMRFWGGKYPKICRKWLILAIFFLLTGGKWGAEPPTGGHLPPMPPLMSPLSTTLLDCCLKNYTTLWNKWSYQLLCKKIVHNLFLTQQLVGSCVSQCCVNF